MFHNSKLTTNKFTTKNNNYCCRHKIYNLKQKNNFICNQNKIVYKKWYILVLKNVLNIEQFIQKYDISKIKKLEQNDPQFLALKQARKDIKNKDENLFLYLTIQCALVGYQISGSGELWRTEFWNKISDDRDILKSLRNEKKSNTNRRYQFLTTSKYNKRIYNIKTKRLVKFENILQDDLDLQSYSNKMSTLQQMISKTMNRPKQSKTITFAIKMFGYACEIINKKETIYPMDIFIPIDSRIKKIYATQFPDNDIDEEKIQEYFNTLSIHYNISPLHLDSILRLDYWKSLNK